MRGWLDLSSGFRQGLFVDSGLWHLPALPGGLEGLRREAFALTPPIEPFVNQLDNLIRVSAGTLRIAYYTVVVPVSLQLALEGGDNVAEG